MISINQKSIELDRRTFLKCSSSILMGSTVAFSLTPDKSKKVPLTCKDVTDHFMGVSPWVDWSNTADGFKAGDPSKPVKKVAVAWKASWDALREAANKGADLFISHESIAVDAEMVTPEPDRFFALPTEIPKFDWLDKSGLAVYRCHDVWDRFPELGVRDSWQKGLDIGDKITADEYPFYVTEVPPMTVRELAIHLLKQIRPLKQNGVPVSGNLEKKISRIGTGTGVCRQPVTLREMGADVGIMTDDYYRHVRTGVHAGELDFPTLFVNHGVAEEWGLKNLASYLKSVFPELDVFHIPQYCPYEIVYDDA